MWPDGYEHDAELQTGFRAGRTLVDGTKQWMGDASSVAYSTSSFHRLLETVLFMPTQQSMGAKEVEQYNTRRRTRMRIQTQIINDSNSGSAVRGPDLWWICVLEDSLDEPNVKQFKLLAQQSHNCFHPEPLGCTRIEELGPVDEQQCPTNSSNVPENEAGIP